MANLAELQAVADAEAAVLAPLTADLGAVPMATVPLLATTSTTSQGLAEIADLLFDRASPAGRRHDLAGSPASRRTDGDAGSQRRVVGRRARPDRRRRRLGHRRRAVGARGPGHHVHRLPHRPGGDRGRPTQQAPDLAVLDLQIGNMGGMAVPHDAAAGRVRRAAAPHPGPDAARPRGRPVPRPPGGGRGLADQAARLRCACAAPPPRSWAGRSRGAGRRPGGATGRQPATPGGRRPRRANRPVATRCRPG